MANYELELINPETGKTEVYRKDFVPLRKTREALAILENTEGKKTTESSAFDDQVTFLAGVFGVTVDDILDGVDASKGQDILNALFLKIVGYDEKKIRKALANQ